MASSAMMKSEQIGSRLELSPPQNGLELWLPMSFGIVVRVGMMGSKLEAQTMEATEFRRATLVIA